MKIAHIINPVDVGRQSDLYKAQPVTFETMRIAQEVAKHRVEVELYTTQFEEDRSIIPETFTQLTNLDRSVLDLRTFQKSKKLPLVRDILDRLFEASDADYFIYTNVDIALKPHFYSTVASLLEEHDALVINRRTISNEYTEVKEIPLMWSELGKAHGGFDCFVFKREAYPKYRFSNTCIGAKGVGVVLYANLIAHAKSFKLLKESDLTFHIGNDMVWKSDILNDFERYNTQQVNVAVQAMRVVAGPLDRTTAHGSFLLDRYHKAHHYYLAEALSLDNPPKELVPIKRRSIRGMGMARRCASLFKHLLIT